MSPAQKNVVPIVLVGAAILFCTKRKNKASAKKIPESGSSYAANSIDKTGVIIRDGKFHVTDWNVWMRTGPHLIKMALKEGDESPENVASNVMRRLFPHHVWPPPKGDPFSQTWLNMVAVVGRAIDRPIQPHFEIVS